MAVITPTYTRTGLSRMRNVSWTLALNDTGAPVKMPQYRDKTVDIYGTFGASGSVTLRGSNKPDAAAATAGDWFTLTDAQANAITKTAKAGEAILENPLWISPICTAGDGTTAITVAINGVK